MDRRHRSLTRSPVICCGGARPRRVAVSDQTWARYALPLQAASGAEFVAAGVLIEELRSVKDSGEQDALRAAGAAVDGVLRELVRPRLGRAHRARGRPRPRAPADLLRARRHPRGDRRLRRQRRHPAPHGQRPRDRAGRRDRDRHRRRGRRATRATSHGWSWSASRRTRLRRGARGGRRGASRRPRGGGAGRNDGRGRRGRAAGAGGRRLRRAVHPSARPRHRARHARGAVPDAGRHHGAGSRA